MSDKSLSKDLKLQIQVLQQSKQKYLGSSKIPKGRKGGNLKEERKEEGQYLSLVAGLVCLNSIYSSFIHVATCYMIVILF